MSEPMLTAVTCAQLTLFTETVDIDVGASICDMAEDVDARLIVLLSRSSQNLVQNMLFGSSITYCVRLITQSRSSTKQQVEPHDVGFLLQVRNCRRPLLIMKS